MTWVSLNSASNRPTFKPLNKQTQSQQLSFHFHHFSFLCFLSRCYNYTRNTFKMSDSLSSAVMSEKVGIIGSGLIGRSWAMLFAAGGFRVSLYDSQENAVAEARKLILQQLTTLQQQGLLRGTLSVEAQFELITEAHSLEDCVTNASYIQECVPENLELKIKLFTLIDQFVDDPDMVLASSSSCIPPSQFSENLTHRAQVLVAHPVNPPYFVPLVELVPAPWTLPHITDKARAYQTKIGQSAVTLRREIPGFALNRIQYAILNECWRLVADKVLSPEDVDTVMKDGLGPRYAFMGPFETIHLNAEGVTSYCDRYADTIYRVSETFGPTPTMTPGGDVCNEIEKEIVKTIPIAELAARRQWRDDRLAELSKLKRNVNHFSH
ncbi:Lambda-crystallin-like protein [Hypsibius exemplaris]|uniref:Lambda-crystallin-like protein n=1 Tax=Hypsibius exemplaris TaxID=2072580 RepID=A0A1W0WRH6_HYPEX|nr:Lambda-crystallin-like protein [Hypsibius exemplaris]